ncbi:DUF58 domain-containing protein [Aeromicrobium wangtongii]|uniref:DUF58 domain-containing protein n=1 Tax=Aeromicrobium wangtongii TaxID=2969247 RepID=A0ABY5MCJ8_9ACTN|nr:DUF58 domain-containing protein [Aeromicrobium wangtongii]MCD9197344.1 DUF58 domain-containing protein [Aeromicrobium wangtongii]UUP14838.1 DUF58 domain-containing protein [Aeromicrobium wangtongii]
MAGLGRDRLVGAARSVVITRRGIGFLVAAVIAFLAAPLLSLPALLYVTGLLLGLVILAAAFVFVGHSSVLIERSFTPQVVSPGTLSRATVRITNLSLLPCLEARWEDQLPPRITGDASGLLPPLGGSRSGTARATFSYTLQGLQRGRHDIGPLQVDVQDPFGLVYRRHAFGSAEPLTVLPRRVELPPISPRSASDDGATRPAAHNAGVGEDDIIARSYLPGDALKRIHWKATAHRAELMVRQEEQQVTPRSAVVLDTEPTSQGTARDRKARWEFSPALEWAVVAAASITAHLVRAGYVVALQSSGPAIDRVVADGQDTLEDAMVDLALAEPETVDRAGRHDVEGAVFAVLGRLSPERARHWVTALSTSRSVLALVARGSSAEALDMLDGARWNVVQYSPGDDLAETWSLFDGEPARAAR